MNDTTISWHRRLYERLRGWGGLMVGLLIGAAAFGASTAGAGGDLKDPGGPQKLEEECAEGCDQEEISEWVWGEPSSRPSGRRRPRPRRLSGWLPTPDR